MSAEELKKLALLSKREREVLWLVCEGHSYQEISQKLYISVPTVKANMGRVYVKLCLDQLKKAERLQAIHQVYWPLLKNSELPSEAPQAETPIPVPEPVARMVDDDERSIIPYVPVPTEIIQIKSIKDDRKFPWRTLIFGFVLGLGVVACAVIAYTNLFMNQDQSQLELELTEAVGQLTQVAVSQANTNTQIPVPTTQPVIVVVTATQPYEPSAPPPTAAPTLPPAPTMTSIPVISLPFVDNFDAGSSPQWKVLNGNWMTADGRYTIAIGDYDNPWLFTMLDEPTWKNYRIRVDVDNPPIQLNYLGVFVRASSTAKYFGFTVTSHSETGWALVTPDDFLPHFIADYGNIDAPSEFNLDIEVSGDQYLARINGAESQRINISGYDNGGIVLGMYCNATSCPSFDNLQIDPLP